MPGSIAILTHALQGLDTRYFLAAIAEHIWRPQGRVVLLHSGLGNPPATDLAMLHLDVTRVPAPYQALAARHPRTLNAKVLDIGKRRIADGLVRPDDGYDGPVIVKTELNHLGLPEQRLRAAGAGDWLDRQRDRLPPRWRGLPPGGDYRVYPRPAAVPRWVWRSPHLVVQRLFVERQGQHYALNQWFFLGAAEVVSTLLAREPLVKWSNRVGNRPLHAEVPDELRRRRAELGFDYGKFDYVVHDGRARLLDANTTPHLGSGDGLTERQQQVLRTLADGI